jgi:hypothetical protein
MIESAAFIAPICHVCSHRHIMGEACATCGHVGQSPMFAKMRVFINLLRCLNGAVTDDFFPSDQAKASFQRSMHIKLIDKRDTSSIVEETEVIVEDLQKQDMKESPHTLMPSSCLPCSQELVFLIQSK